MGRRVRCLRCLCVVLRRSLRTFCGSTCEMLTVLTRYTKLRWYLNFLRGLTHEVLTGSSKLKRFRFLQVVFVMADHGDRIISRDSYGQKCMQHMKNHERSGFINIHYSSRALEWINVRRLFQELLIFFQFSHMCSLVENIIFAWSYDRNLASVLYKPAAIFK